MLALYLAACHTPEAVTTVFKCSWGWTQKASETCRVLLQLLINILPSCITLVLYIYYDDVSRFQTFTMFWMFYAFFWVIPWLLNFVCWRFRTLRLFHLLRPMKMEQTEFSKTLAYKIQKPGNYPEESIKYDDISSHSFFCLKVLVLINENWAYQLFMTPCFS